MYDRAPRLLGGNGAHSGGGDVLTSRAKLQSQADANPAGFETTAPKAGSIEIRCRRIGEEDAALNVDLRALGDEDAIEGVRRPNQQNRERWEITQVHAVNVVPDISEPIGRRCEHGLRFRHQIASVTGRMFTFCRKKLSGSHFVLSARSRWRFGPYATMAGSTASFSR